MDVFSRGTGIDFVRGFAARLFLAVGNGLGSTLADAEAKALGREEEPRDVWAMCLLLVRWWQDQLSPAEAKAVDQAFDSAGQSLARGLSLVRDQLSPFVRACLDATDEAGLVRAGGGFLYFLRSVGLNRVRAALGSSEATATLERLRLKVPLLDELGKRYVALLGIAPDPAQRSAPPTTAPSRAERFERADLRVPPTRPPSLDPRERLVAVLVSRGYSEGEIQRILRGKSGEG